jgi:TetR/AcrR family transcriptional regulator, upper aerobic nicotinate degradation pathway regulator
MAYGLGTRSKGRYLRARQRGNRRSDEILEAALQLFSERGYTAASIKEIARVSGINSALIYYYFASKDQLFVEALKYSAQAASLHHLQSCAQSENPVAAINLWFETNARMAKPLGQMVRLMLDFRMSRRRSASVERLIRNFYEAEVSLLLRNIAEGVKSGVFRAVDVEQTALFVSTHLDGLMVAASVRVDYDLQSGFRHMRKVLFAWLGYSGANNGKESCANGSRARVAA